MRKLTITLFAALFATSAFAWPVMHINSVAPTTKVPVPPKRVDAFKGWKPPLEVQNKGGNAVVPAAPVKK